MFVGLIQGLVLRWELGERGDSLVDPLGTMFRMWLERRGHAVAVESLAADHWLVEVVVGGAPAIDEARALATAAVDERVREALGSLAPGAAYLARVATITSSLQRLVRSRGEVRERPGGGALARVVG